MIVIDPPDDCVKLDECPLPSSLRKHCSKLEECPLLRNQRKDYGEDDNYEWIGQFVVELSYLNQKTKTLLRNEADEFVCDLCEKSFFKRWFDAKTEEKMWRFIDKVYNVDSESGGTSLGARTLVIFMKLGRGIPDEVILKEERNMGASLETARKRVYRALKLRQRFGLPTHSLTLAQWESFERFAQLLKKAESY